MPLEPSCVSLSLSLCPSFRALRRTSRLLTSPPSRSRQFDQFYPREIRRNRRTWERAFGGLAVFALLYFLVFRSSPDVNPNGAAPFKQRAGKVGKGGAQKNPLKSNIPLHSFRANLKEGHGYVTSFPYGGLSTLSSFPSIHFPPLL